MLTLYSYLDDKIQTILSLQMRYLENQNARSRIFGPRGPLSNFSSRVLVAYHLGWLSNRQRLRLDAARAWLDIRRSVTGYLVKELPQEKHS